MGGRLRRGSVVEVVDRMIGFVVCGVKYRVKIWIAGDLTRGAGYK